MKIIVLPGDGIGPEITEATLSVLDRANARFKLGLQWQRSGHGRLPRKSPAGSNVCAAGLRAPAGL